MESRRRVNIYVWLLCYPINFVGLERPAMMRPRTIKIIATVLIFMIGLTFVAGWDIVFNQHVSAEWICKSILCGGGGGTLDW